VGRAGPSGWTAADSATGDRTRCAGGVAALETLLELVGVDAAVDVMAAQRLGDALALGVRRPQVAGRFGRARWRRHALSVAIDE